MTTKSLDQWLEFISETHPSEIEMGLERVKSVYAALPDYNSQAKIVLVAGTNGKGSTIGMMEAGLLALGYNVGTYTSPHIQHYNERVRINLANVEDVELIRAFEAVEKARGSTPLTYFEYGTLAAFDILLAKDLDVILLEIGLGGRLDAVNIVDPDLSVITSIGLDHTDWLGDTLEEIGAEKAGILRPHTLFVGGENLPKSVASRAKELLSQTRLCRRDFNFSNEHGVKQAELMYKEQTLTLQGVPQSPLPENNILVSLQSIACLLNLINPAQRFSQAIYETLINAIESLVLPGRLETVLHCDTHHVLLDVGHNPHAAAFLKVFLESQRSPETVIQIVYSSLNDKDAQGVLTQLSPVASRCIVTKLACERAMSLKELNKIALAAGFDTVESHHNVTTALNSALNYPQTLTLPANKVITLILGSFFMVEAAKHFMETYD